MRIETYLDAMVQAWQLAGEYWQVIRKFNEAYYMTHYEKRMRQYRKFHQRIIDCTTDFIDVVEPGHKLWRCHACNYHNYEPYKFCDKCGAARWLGG